LSVVGHRMTHAPLTY